MHSIPAYANDDLGEKINSKIFCGLCMKVIAYGVEIILKIIVMSCQEMLLSSNPTTCMHACI